MNRHKDGKVCSYHSSPTQELVGAYSRGVFGLS